MSVAEADATAALADLDDEAHACDPPFTPSDFTATVQPDTTPRAAARVLDDFAVAVARCGVVGEIATAQLLYLVLTARLLDKPVSAAVKGLSASGKSFTTEQVVRFFPPEAVMLLTGMSEHALIYSKEDYQHRVIVLYEAEALRDKAEDNHTAYFVRTLLSEGRLNYQVIVRDGHGGFTTKMISKEGPTGLIVTTTRTHLHPENETRMLTLTTNDSREQTKAIFRAIAGDDDAQHVDLKPWIQIQTALQSAEHRVYVPYADALAEIVPPVAVRLRRDFSLVLSLVKAHAILHQPQRARTNHGRIIANFDDYEVVRNLTADLLSEGVGQMVKATTRETVRAVEVLNNPEGVSALAIVKHLKLDKATVSRRVSVAASRGYLRNLETKRGQPGRWIVGEPLPESVAILPSVAELQAGCKPLRNSQNQAQQGSCTVANVPLGIKEGTDI